MHKTRKKCRKPLRIQKNLLPLQRNVKYNSFNMKDKMKRQNVFFAAAVCGLMALASCAEEVMNEQMAEPNSRLSVQTRTGSDVTLALPVHIYIFNAENSCVAAQTIESGNEMSPVVLTEGTYDIYAIGGADDTHYSLPSQQQASKSSEISLKEGQPLTDLMTASAHRELADGAQEELTIELQRQVLQLKSITVRDVPEAFTSVSVQVSKLYESLQLDGTPTGTNGSVTVNLTQNSEDNSLWELESTSYLLPSNGKPTITVSFSNGTETKSYVYACKEALPANYKLTIDGTYNSTQGVTISGTITGATWSGEKTISLTFNEKDDNTTGSETTDDTSSSGGGDTPSGNEGGNGGESGNDVNDYTVLQSLNVGDVYHGCYVMEKTATSIKLLSATEEKNITSKTALTEAIDNWNVNDVTATWRIPTVDEAKAFIAEYREINAIDGVLQVSSTGYYYCTSSNKNYAVRLSAPSTMTFSELELKDNTTPTYNNNYSLRPVADITINN